MHWEFFITSSEKEGRPTFHDYYENVFFSFSLILNNSLKIFFFVILLFFSQKKNLNFFFAEQIIKSYLVRKKLIDNR
jgi:hypothetical protein